MKRQREKTHESIKAKIAAERAIKAAHDRVRPLLELGLAGEARDLQARGADGREIAVRSALRMLVAAEYVGPARTVLEWACKRRQWVVGAVLAGHYLAHDVDAKTRIGGASGPNVEAAEEVVGLVNARHHLTSVEPWVPGERR